MKVGLKRGRLVPTTLFVATLLLYISTLTQVHTFDALSYVTSVEHKPWTEVFHPHHLAYGPLGALALALGRVVGFAGGAALPMQLVNAVAGALGVALLFNVVRRITQRADVALVAALLLGGAYAYWYYAVEIEVYTVATLFLIACLDLLARIITRPTRRLYVLLGFTQGGAVLFHQTNLLFCIPALIVLGDQICRASSWHPAGSRWKLLRWGAVYALVLALSVGIPYLFVAIVSGFQNIGDFTAWLTEYARTGWWGGPITANNWARLAMGLTDTLAQPGGALFWLLLVGLLVLHVRRLIHTQRLLCVALLAWLLVYGAFFFWWEADNIEFWIASLPPAALLLALSLSGERHWGPGICVALSVCAAAFGVNYDAITARGNARNDLQRTIARTLAERSTFADLLLVPDGLLELYLPYYESHDNFLSLNQALFDHNEHWPQACDAVHARIETALHAGATALIADEVLRPPPLLMTRHHLSQTQVDQCFAPYRAALIEVPVPASVPSYWRLPKGEERAQADGWHFIGVPDGWLAGNVRDQHFNNGWVFTPERDPSLTSPLLNIQASDYRAVEIRLANGTHARDAQLFFAGPDGAISEARALHWTLKATSEVQTYTLDLRAAPGWQGTITRLRLDPVGIGDGGSMRIEAVRLIPTDKH